MTAAIRIHVVTYRRPVLLERALRSLMAQTRPDWVAEVLNDDPADTRPAEVVARLADPRIILSKPAIHRGGAGNFNHAFRRLAEPFSSILEDDNWWQPEFLAIMLAALDRRPDVALACANERIWREQADGSWSDTGVTIWPVSDQPIDFPLRVIDKCGSAKLCNSAMVFRTREADSWRTPDDIPVDVTEHFRERVIPHPLLLVPIPLVNYAETLHTHRARGPGLWGEYQALLIGSVFELAQPSRRLALARQLWTEVRSQRPQSATTLVSLGLGQKSARALWAVASPRERARFLLSALRHPLATFGAWCARDRHPAAWRFLLQGHFADSLASQTSLS